MKKFLKLLVIAMVFAPSLAMAQSSEESSAVQGKSGLKKLFYDMNRHGVLNKLELAANIGTTGLGLELASPVTKWTKLRVGVDFMPKFCVPMTFNLNSYVDGHVNDKFDRIQEIMYDLSGMTIDRDVNMESKPTMTNFRLLVDVYPFRNKHWHITAGFFLGGNSVGTSINRIDEMPSLLVLNMYDRLYHEVTAEDFIEKIIDNPIINDIYLDPEIAQVMQDKFRSFGELCIHVGDHKDGTPYMMMPDEDGTVSAKAKVNRFRPYLGFGYGGFLDSDHKWHASFDAGAQFWGGAPKVVTHDGTVLNDLVNLRGKVDTYMNLMKTLVVYPTLDFRIAYCF